MTSEELAAIKAMSPDEYDRLQGAVLAKTDRRLRSRAVREIKTLMRQERDIRRAGIADAIQSPEDVEEIAQRTALLLKPFIQKREYIERATGVHYSEESV